MLEVKNVSTSQVGRSPAFHNYLKVEKKFKTVTGILAGVSAVGLVVGSLRSGLTFPAKALSVVGDFFGSISSIVSPFFLIGNEIINFKVRSSKNGDREEREKIKKAFDAAREGFYRCSSLGFTPFIFEPFINPEKFGKSIFHKIATVGNIPNLFFTGYMWGVGNFKALLAWGLRTKEQISKGENEQGYHELYETFKRMAVIGSIANPTMQGLRQCADSLALLAGKFSSGEFFERPLLGLSRLVSLASGLPEFYAKGVDSVLRVVKEQESIKAGLPKFLHKPLEKLGKVYRENIATENIATENIATKKSTLLKAICYYAESIFHTLSPLSMFALFTPLLDEPHLNEEAQAQGGLVGTLDKIIGRGGKALTLLFNGLYVTFGRLPQAFIQSVYFGRRLIGWAKGEDKEVTRNKLEDLRERICNSSLVKGLSNFAQSRVKSLVKDFYEEDVENKQGYLTYDQIQSDYAVEQAKNSKEYEELVELGKKCKGEKSELRNKADVLISDILKKYCIPFIKEDALRSYYSLNAQEIENIRNKIVTKLKQRAEILPELKREELKFPGAEFLATYVFKLLDLRTRFQKIDYRSDHHNMTTAYDNDEIRISFEYELLPVLCKCVQGLRNTVDRAFGMAA